MTEKVDHPPHYGGGDNPHETIKCLRSWLSVEQYKGFVLGNCLKYLSRLGKKDDELVDAGKARWYLNELIDFLQSQQEQKQ